MDDDDRDALAAEYVLGTLSSEEREQAEALLARDVGFAETVRVWEHRLGELNVMVEAVEPPADLWERIKTGIDGAERRSQATSETVELTGLQFEPTEAATPANGAAIEAGAEPALQTVPGAEPALQTVPNLLSEPASGSQEPKVADTANTADLASTLLASQSRAEFVDRPPTSTAPRIAAAAASVGYDHSIGVWRGLAIAASVIAVMLAAYIVAGQLAPGVRQRPVATVGATQSASVPRLLAVLQQDPAAPAFLVMLDPEQRTITVRRLTAAPDSGRSYELWLYSTKLPKPVSLGAVGNTETTSRPIPQNIDAETLRSATYAVSLEPGTGGSATGAPSGPILFKGGMIEAAPGSSG
jgi:anti-sigma-K factor RskA